MCNEKENGLNALQQNVYIIITWKNVMVAPIFLTPNRTGHSMLPLDPTHAFKSSTLLIADVVCGLTEWNVNNQL